MTKYVAPEEILAELNRVVEQHNAMAADFLRCLAWLSRQLAIGRKKVEQFDTLLEESNRLLSLAQRARALQEENDHLWRVIAELDNCLRKYQ
jgi:ABC-type transporter Mla subunit MlaD